MVDGRGWFLGKAFYSKHSKISLRWLSYEDVPVDADFFRQRLAARGRAAPRAPCPGETTYRVVHGEADLLPGLVVDRYGDYLSVQFLVPGHRAAQGAHRGPAGGAVQAAAPSSTARTWACARWRACPRRRACCAASCPGPVPYDEGLVRMRADLLEGQKTGAFLDQRENHVVASQYAFGEALDCFSYVGGFALQLATRAKKVTAVEISEAAAAQLRENAAANRLTNVDVVVANAFDFLRDAVDEGRQFDTIVLDPPSFAKNKDAIDGGAARLQGDQPARHAAAAARAAILITASCTYHVDEQAFEEMLASAAADAKRRVQIIEKRGAGKDHPVLLSLRETRYLKCFVLRVL